MYSVLGMFIKIMSICVKKVFLQNCRDVDEVLEKKNAVFASVFFMLLQEKQKEEKNKTEKGQKPIKIVSFKVVIQK